MSSWSTDTGETHAKEIDHSGVGNRPNDAGSGACLWRSSEWLQGARPLHQREQSRLSQYASAQYLDSLRLVLTPEIKWAGPALAVPALSARHADRSDVAAKILTLNFNPVRTSNPTPQWIYCDRASAGTARYSLR